MTNPPKVLGYQFIDLAKETRFIQDFEKQLKSSPSRLDERWYSHGYHDLFAANGELSDGSRVCWGKGRGTQKFTMLAEGQLGSAPGITYTVPLVILLQYEDPLPSAITASHSVKYRIEYATSRMLSRLLYPLRHKIKFTSIHLCRGPGLPVEEGDGFASRKSFTFRRTSAITETRLDLCPEEAVVIAGSQKTAVGIIGTFLEGRTKSQRRLLFAAGEEECFRQLQSQAEVLNVELDNVTWPEISHALSEIYKVACAQASSQLNSDTAVDSEPVLQRNNRFTSSGSPVVLKSASRSSGDSPLDPDLQKLERLTQDKRDAVIRLLRTTAAKQRGER